MKTDYLSLQIKTSQAAEIAESVYAIKGEVIPLPGEVDFNFRIRCETGSYILKVTRPDYNPDFIDYHLNILSWVSNNKLGLRSPKLLPDKDGNYFTKITDASGSERVVRLLTWIDGRVWSSVNPQKEELLNSLGEQVGMLAKSLQGFDHPIARRNFEWDVAQAEWTLEYMDLFNPGQQNILKFFHKRFNDIQAQYKSLRKGVVHNDANDNNVIVTEDLIHPEVKAIIDYGDAIYTQTINDLAITVAYAIMNKPDMLGASMPIIRGYHKYFPLLEEELAMLYTLVAMRLVISVTKSAINKKEEPENEYLLISEKPAWDVLERWIQINENYAHYCFREACGFMPHPEEEEFKRQFTKHHLSLKTLFPTLKFEAVHTVDMGIASTWLGHESEYEDNELFEYKINKIKQQNPNTIIAGGYLEVRPFYCTDAYKKEGNNGPEYRAIHLGTDFWVKANTPIHAIVESTVHSIYNNDNDKDYGPTLILEHKTEGGTPYYTLYGHLSKSSLSLHKAGRKINKGDLIGYVGQANENGNWAPHLHFQLMLDMLGNEHDFPGVATPNQIKVWQSICPDINVMFGEEGLKINKAKENAEIITFRKKHLGKSLSLSYAEPLQIQRGAGVFLIDDTGRKYLDTVNNVAHVGHENARVVKAGQGQMAILNTNSRYLHENINEFAEELLSTFPKELSVVHFVNSGSEANELALRMTRAYKGRNDMIAAEIGYHGNTSGCISISSYKFDGKGGSGALENTHIVPLPDAFRGIYRGENTGPKYAAHIQDQIEKIQIKGRQVAGFICESIISCGGQIELPKDYLKIAYQSVRKAGGLCISDEVQVGCGRVGVKFWGFQLHDVIPDIVTIGKPIGNGHPLAAVVCTQEVANAFANGMEYFNTFGGNPVSCAIGREVLRVIKSENLQENALNVGNYLKAGLAKLQIDFPIIGDIRGQGLFLGFELVDNNMAPLTSKANYLADRMKELGILMSTDGKDNNVMKIKPPIVFSIENADELIKRLQTVFNEDFMKN